MFHRNANKRGDLVNKHFSEDRFCCCCCVTNLLKLETFFDATLCENETEQTFYVDKTRTGYEYVKFMIESDSMIELQSKQWEFFFLIQFIEIHFTNILFDSF